MVWLVCSLYARMVLPLRIEKQQETQDVYFEYGDAEIEYLKRKDKILGEANDNIGHIHREVDGYL